MGCAHKFWRSCFDVIARPCLVIFDRSWQLGEMPEDWRKANGTLIFKKGKEDPGNYRPVSLTSIPGKVMEQLILDSISRHMKDKKVIGDSQHGATKRNSCSTNLITLYDEVTGLVGEGRAVDIVCLDFSKAFNCMFRKILIEKLLKYGLDQPTHFESVTQHIHSRHGGVGLNLFC
ncbi:hypothetical protein QYF61_022888 [Mycteria americana]|uniref:Reverse transcriptase domain-containing protein n=1 Tax=Mycteria americana TaxID=33587 RepID=A0AAN7N301_MYCAM|nr:hypothetical protein QYF61_022888 [Mycteria americana]